MEPRLKETIIKEINPSLKEMFGYKSLYMGPKIEKIVLNMGNIRNLFPERNIFKCPIHINKDFTLFNSFIIFMDLTSIIGFVVVVT